MNFVVFSHLRWNFVFQRPQHLMTRCALEHNVFFCEEPIFDSTAPRWEISLTESGVRVAVPHLPPGLTPSEIEKCQATMVAELFRRFRIKDPVLWFYTPMALTFASSLKAKVTVYDCMDELTAFRGAPPGLSAAEAELFKRADLVFTGGQSLFEVKRSKHPSVHCLPSSIDREFFASARGMKDDPIDHSGIGHPRLGYAGVIDERMDVKLLGAIANARPSWNFVLLGPVVKIDPADLPQRPNIHYLGSKPYGDLPRYMGNWDVALLPFAMNESTKFISPTKTPEYLAAGLPVVSTPIVDVVRPYGENNFVHIAANPEAFVDAIESALGTPRTNRELAELERFLMQNSWDKTWHRMSNLIDGVINSSVHTYRVGADLNPALEPAASVPSGMAAD